MRQAAVRGWVGWLLVALGAAAGVADEPSLTRYKFEQVRFAAPVRLAFYAPSEEVANGLAKSVFDRLKQFDRIMSDYDPDSELSKLCDASGPGRPVKVSEELWDVLAASQRFSKSTEGAFDVSVGPVVKLWRVARRKKTLPANQDLADALAKVDWRSIVLNEANHTVELKREGMRLDLGGIAQGYAADEALKILKTGGVTRAMVDVSGDIRVGDPPPGERGWRIVIESAKGPSASEGIRTLLLANVAVSTSGDAYQFVEIDGVRYSHIVDPKTGIGLTMSRSVTVIAPDALTADGLDTAICVQGVEQGLKTLGEFPKTEALIATVTDGRIAVVTSPGFTAFESPGP